MIPSLAQGPSLFLRPLFPPHLPRVKSLPSLEKLDRALGFQSKSEPPHGNFSIAFFFLDSSPFSSFRFFFLLFSVILPWNGLVRFFPFPSVKPCVLGAFFTPCMREPDPVYLPSPAVCDRVCNASVFVRCLITFAPPATTLFYLCLGQLSSRSFS